MKLSVIRGGGLAGIATRTELVSDGLPPETARTLREQVAESGLRALRAPTPAPEAAPDDLQYEITLEDEGARHVVRLADGALPDPVRALISWLDSVPERDEGIHPPAPRT
jgi:hypothetical protein